MVLTGHLYPDSTIKVVMSSSKKFTGDLYFESLKDVKIKLFEEESLLGEMTYDPEMSLLNSNYWITPGPGGSSQKGIYIFDYHPQSGKTYQIQAEHQNYKTIESITKVPKMGGRITSINITERNNDNFIDFITLKISILDMEPGDNYYHLTMRSRDSILNFYENGETYVGEYRPEYYTFNKTEIEKFLYDTDLDGSLQVLDDKLFNQDRKDLDVVLLGSPQRDLNGNQFSSYKNLLIELRSVNKDYYDFYRTLFLQRENEDNPFVEPVFIYNNIENGLGNFSAYSSETYSYTIEF